MRMRMGRRKNFVQAPAAPAPAASTIVRKKTRVNSARRTQSNQEIAVPAVSGHMYVRESFPGGGLPVGNGFQISDRPVGQLGELGSWFSKIIRNPIVAPLVSIVSPIGGAILGGVLNATKKPGQATAPAPAYAPSPWNATTPGLVPAAKSKSNTDIALDVSQKILDALGNVLSPGNIRTPNIVDTANIRASNMNWMPWAVGAGLAGIALVAVTSRRR